MKPTIAAQALACLEAENIHTFADLVRVNGSRVSFDDGSQIVWDVLSDQWVDAAPLYGFTPITKEAP